MRQIVIAESDAFRLTSYGNGEAHSLERLEDGAAVFVQGDDSTVFREEWERVNYNLDQSPALRLLWCEYSSAAHFPDGFQS